MTLTLAATSDCAAAGAVCTADGRRLQSEFNVSVPGPAAFSVAGDVTLDGDATTGFLGADMAGQDRLAGARWRWR